MDRIVLEKSLRLGAGVILLLLGLAMLVLPGPGLLFLAGGLYLIVTVFPGGKERVEVLRQKFNRWREERRARRTRN